MSVSWSDASRGFTADEWEKSKRKRGELEPALMKTSELVENLVTSDYRGRAAKATFLLEFAGRLGATSSIELGHIVARAVQR